MAISSINERRSALLPTLPFRGMLPIPDTSAETASDRTMLSFLYGRTEEAVASRGWKLSLRLFGWTLGKRV